MTTTAWPPLDALAPSLGLLPMGGWWGFAIDQVESGLTMQLARM